MGNRLELDVDIQENDVRPGDVYLLCSDGLNSMLQDKQIAETLTAHAKDPKSACRSLIEQANERGGEDNITVIVLS